ncbi:MAG: manganese efflux pump MntP family protein [Pseudoxanthomonas sp.]
MNPISILLLGLAMSTDAFAAALGKGAGMLKPTVPQALRVGLIFGVVEAITPLIGWLLGSAAARFIQQWDHWAAFGLLFALGLHMLYKAFFAKEEPDQAASGSVVSLALTGLATSIDAMAVGVGLAFVEVNILVVSVVIGLCTFVMVSIGILAGRMLSALIGKWAEAVGGLVLIAVGATILYEHLSAASVA